MALKKQGLRPDNDLEKCLMNNEITYCDWREESIAWEIKDGALTGEGDGKGRQQAGSLSDAARMYPQHSVFLRRRRRSFQARLRSEVPCSECRGHGRRRRDV